MSAAKVEVNAEGMRNYLPEFADCEKYSSEYLISNINMALSFIPATNKGPLCDSLRQNAIYLMAAHLLTLRGRAVAGKGGSSSGQVGSSSVGSVSVSYVAPPNSDQRQYWYNQTIYGQMLMALFRRLTAGGRYIGGSVEAVLR